MRLTKYEHSCVVLEEQGRQLVIDPGKFSQSLPELTDVVAVVITHVHSDHFDEAQLQKILSNNPKAKVYGPPQVASEAKSTPIQAVNAGESLNIATFDVECFGGAHELYEGFDNIAVLVNNAFYHPGDSYTVPDKPVKVLGWPASAPWLRVPDTVAFLQAVKPEAALPIHNALLSEIGESIHYRILSEAAAAQGVNWQVINIGETLEIT